MEETNTNQRNITKVIAQAAIIGAMYAALTVLIMPASYGIMQFRVSEALTVLPIFTPAAIPGLFIGCVVANIVSPVGLIDVFVGSAATLIAAVLTYKLRDNKLVALLPPVIADTHDDGPVFSEDEEAPTGKKRRKKRAGTWNTTETGEIAKVSIKKILANMRRNKAIGGLIFNPYDEKRSMAIAKFLI